MSVTPAPAEDRAFAAVIYGLFLLGLACGVTLPAGLVLAYLRLPLAGPGVRSHHVFQVRTIWIALGLSLAGCALILVGLPLSLVLIGVPMVQLGIGLFGLIYVWLLARCISGAYHLALHAPYPRPASWLI